MILTCSWLIYAFIPIIPLIYWHLKRKFNYWDKRGVKGPKPIPIFGNILDILITPQTEVDCTWLNQYGKIYGYYFGKTPILTIADPELIKTVLVKDFHLFIERRKQKSIHPIMSKVLVSAVGDDWKRIRSIVNPIFKSCNIKIMYPLMRQCMKEFINYLDSFANEGENVDMKSMYGKYTMDIIATCDLGTKIDVYQEIDNKFIAIARKLFNFSAFRLIPELMFPLFINKCIKFGNFEESNKFFLNTTRNILNSRRKGSHKNNDFIQLLIDVERDQSIDWHKKDIIESNHVNQGEEELDIEKKALNIVSEDKHLSDNDIVAQSMNFLLAGYETTSTTLTYCSYELAMNPDIQERLYNEVMSAVDSKGDIDYEVLTRLPYLDAVISETLRLHCPSLRLARIAYTDYNLGDTGVIVEKGMQIEIPVYAIHHSKEYFETPFKFIPERFIPENRHNIKPYTYIPFGAGPRHCIGFRFALMEIKLCLFHIVMKYKFNKTSETVLKHQKYYRLNSPKHLILSFDRRMN